ncbi:MAG TPA: Holliday junction resolvase RuvX [Bacilli bacterium]|nr:Holliday junction resolvase RuvX [Bacilli bacterium]HPS18742.1 Holliday junction resolvase RuvX [Bacilli bacterium]
MKKILGLDLGTTTLGIAQSDSLGFVHGVETFRFPKNQYIIARQHVLKLVEELEIEEIALGLPLHLSGQMSDMANNAMRFRDDLLAANPNLRIAMVDERLSSVTAHDTISARGMSHEQRKQNVDKIAACVILDTYIRTKEFNHGK